MKQWMEIMRECRSSGHHVRFWCIDHDVNEKRYYYWLRKVRTAVFDTILLDIYEGSHQTVPLKIEELKLESIDGLAGIVQQNFKLDPFQNRLFLFCGRKKERLKALYWERDGFVLLCKRLESGRFQWPRDTECK